MTARTVPPGGRWQQLQRQPLMLALNAAFALAAPLAMASTVTSCDDSATAATTPGTLRYAVANAASGDTIDFNLPPICSSTITLHTGLTIAQNDLSLAGPAPPASKVIVKKYSPSVPSGLLIHQGTGTLSLGNLEVATSSYIGGNAAKGGCIHSNGSLLLINVDVHDCYAGVNGLPSPGNHYTSYGGAIYAAGDLEMLSSTITNSEAGGFASNNTQCGGADVRGKLTMFNSIIANNKAYGYVAFAGGACARKGALIVNSTISGNQSTTNTKGGPLPFPAPFGGLLVQSTPAAAGNYALQIFQSTISGNYSYSQPGAIYSNVPTLVQNSTIAQNTVLRAFSSAFNLTEGAGLDVAGPVAVMLDNSLFAGNLLAGSANDVSIRQYFDPGKDPTITGQKNLVFASPQPALLPADTIVGQCARLGPLRDNGGPTQTHALLSGSPAIDAGDNNNFGALPPAAYDQRGSPYVRESPGGAPDIGAYEVQKVDIVFNADFEGCP